MSAPHGLPVGVVRAVELEVDREKLARRAAADELAPSGERALARYVLYLGAAYLEAERTAAGAPDPAEAFERLHRLYGAVGGEAAVLRFRYGESARGYADEKRAQAAHERMAGAYEALVEKMQAEISTREERIRNLEAALAR